MIYCIPKKNYPKKGQHNEEIVYKDQNDFEWKIARIENGFIIGYFGDDYFSPNSFECELEEGITFRINNTRCILIQDTNFDTFVHFRTILNQGFTDDIWDVFEELFTERLQINSERLECEVL